MASQLQRREDTDDPAPLRYGLWSRIGDRFNGWRDGVKRLPAVTVERPVLVTPYLQKLNARATTLYDGEWRRLEASLESDLKRFAQVRAQLIRAVDALPAATESLAEAEDRLARGRQEYAERHDQSGGEFGEARIRWWEQTRQLKREVADQRRVVEALQSIRDESKLEMASLFEEIAGRVRRSNNEVRLAADHIASRWAAYLKALVDSHPRGHAIRENFVDKAPVPPPEFAIRASEATGELYVSIDNGQPADSNWE